MQGIEHWDEDLVVNACGHRKLVKVFQDRSDVLLCGCSDDNAGSVILRLLEPLGL